MERIELNEIEAFCAAMREQLLSVDIATRKAHLRLFVERVQVDDAEVRLFGSEGALEAGLYHGPGRPDEPALSSVREWRAGRELHDHHDRGQCARRQAP